MELEDKIEYIQNNIYTCPAVTEDMIRLMAKCNKCQEPVVSFYIRANDENSWFDLHYHSRLVYMGRKDEVPVQWKGAMAVNIEDGVRIECACGNDTRKKYVKDAFSLYEIERNHQV